jgi:hypothetical protein
MYQNSLPKSNNILNDLKRNAYLVALAIGGDNSEIIG